MRIIGIDLAKSVFHVCVMNECGRVERRLRVHRGSLVEAVVKLGSGLVAFEACGGAHYWARRFKEHGYEVRIIAAQFVKPFVKSNKNDTIDAEAICEAASRPRMRFVSARSEEQQDTQNLHRIRERLVRGQVALSNEIRGLLLEYGIVIAKGMSQVRRKLLELVEAHGGARSGLWRETFTELYREFMYLDERIEHYEKRLRVAARSDERCKRLEEIPGVGYLTATAIVAAVGNPHDFKNGRQFAAWLGLVPKQNSTGGKVSLGRISKRGDKYIRKLLVQGASSSAIAAQRKNKQDTTSRWLFKLASRRGGRRAVVALANKTARRIWVVLSGKDFKLQEEILPLAA
jgi:transposase